MMWKQFTYWSLKTESAYKAMGYPFLPVTRVIRSPMRWFYHRSPLFRHDNRFYVKPFLLKVLHAMLVVDHPHDFRIYEEKLAFRSYGSFMSVEGYYVGEIESHLVRYVTSQLTPGFTMLDIGAHHGVYTLIPAYELASRRWKGTIHSFEPNPYNFSILSHNVRKNKLSQRVVLHNQATSDRNGKQKLFFSTEENSDCRLESVQEGDGGGFQNNVKQKNVNVITLDSLLSRIKKVHLIKMDVQGAELATLKGSEKLISRDKPVFVIEAVQGWPSTEKIKTFLRNHDYTLYGVTKEGKLCPLDSPDAFVSWDLVGVPKNKGLVSN